MNNPIVPVLARHLAGVIVGLVLAWLADQTGFAITEADREGLTASVTMVGVAVWGFGYAFTEKLLKLYTGERIGDGVAGSPATPRAPTQAEVNAALLAGIAAVQEQLQRPQVRPQQGTPIPPPPLPYSGAGG